MAITVYEHEKLPLLLVVYSGLVTSDDLDIFSRFFSHPELFSLKNDGIALLDSDTSFSEISFSVARSHAKKLERISLQHAQNGHHPPEMVPLVVASFTQRMAARLWTAATELTPKIKPRYQVCKSPADAVSLLNLPSEAESDIRTRENFKALTPPTESQAVA